MTSRGGHVALLRGINVGGKHVLSMKDLVAIFVEFGARDVRTYVQSGNVIFTATATVARALPGRVERAVAERFGFEAPVQTRSFEELRGIVADSPFTGEDADPATLGVLFLAKAPSANQVAALDPERSPGDVFVVRGRAVHLRCPNGFARTKLTNAWFDARLSTIGTLRNWRTVTKLLDLLGAPPSA